MKRFIGILILLFLIGFGCYYFFIDTLMFSEIVGTTNNPTAEIFIKLLDFNTGLTRYDIYRLRNKSDYWSRRMSQVLSIRDPKLREIEDQRLVAEMMQDPTIKKITRKFFGFGGKSVLAIIEAARTFKCFGLF